MHTPVIYHIFVTQSTLEATTEMSNIKNGHRCGKENIYDQDVTERRCHTNRIKEDRIPNRIEQPFLEATRTNRYPP